MFWLSPDDKAYFCRLRQYWRDRSDNPMVILGRIRKKRFGARVLFFALFSVTAFGGLFLPWGGWLFSLAYRSGAGSNHGVQELLALYGYYWLGVAGSSLVLPALCLTLFARGASDVDQLSDLAVTSTSAGELAFGAVWNGAKAFLILMTPPSVGMALATFALPMAVFAEEGLDDAWETIATLSATLLLTLASLVTCLWTFLAAVRCWLSWRGKLARFFLLSPIIANIWLAIPWAVGIGILWAVAMLFFEVLRNRSNEVLTISAALWGTLGLEILLVIYLSARLLRGAGFLAGAKYFRELKQAEFECRSWLANEAAGRAESRQRKAAAKALPKRGGQSLPILLACLFGTAAFLGLFFAVQRTFSSRADWMYDGSRMSLLSFLVAWPAMASALSLCLTARRRGHLAVLSGGLLPTAWRLVAPCWVHALGPTILAVVLIIGTQPGSTTELVLACLLLLAITLTSQLLLLLFMAIALLRFRASPWVPAGWWAYVLVQLVGAMAIGGRLSGDLANYLAGLGLISVAVIAQYLLGFRYWDWVQTIHDRFLRDHARHEIVEIAVGCSANQGLELDAHG